MTTASDIPTTRLLIVDDDREDYILTREMLKEVAGRAYVVTWESSLEKGLEQLQAETFDACLVDYRLGSRTGMDFLNAVNQKGLQTPLLLLTGNREPRADIAALEAGAADYLIKGTLTQESLDRAVQHAITRQRVLMHAIKERTRLAAFGAELGRALSGMGSLESVLQECAAGIVRFLPVQLAQVHVFNPKDGELRLAGSAGPLSSAPPQSNPAAVDYIHGQRSISCPAAEDHRLADRQWLLRNHILSAITCPLMLNEHLLGLVTLHSRDVVSDRVLEELLSVAPGIASFLARHALEAQVRRTQQMDCVGTMATGLAHEFKNNLMVIRTHVADAGELLEQRQTDLVGERLGHIVAVIESATHLAQQLMLVARPQAHESHPLDLNQTLIRLKPMIQGAVDQRVSLRLECLAESPIVESDAGVLQQVIINLASNARDAMPYGGSLLIRTDNVVIDSAQAATIPEATAGRFVRMQVTDTGCGMSPETLLRLFELFFTTKPPGKGNGLGLATVANIVRQHRGWMSVQSALGKGTTFNIHLPVCNKPVAIPATPPPSTSAGAPAPAGDAVMGSQQRILIVEDEPVLRMSAEQTLRRANFDVVTAASGNEAMRAWKDNGGRFDVLLTDLSMPEGMTGVQLATHLVHENPRIKIILTSGYAEELVDRDVGGAEAMFLQKPYAPGLLPETVKRCLGI